MTSIAWTLLAGWMVEMAITYLYMRRWLRELAEAAHLRDIGRTVAIPLGGVAGDSYDVVAKCHQCDLPIMVRIVTSLSGCRG